jgi:hypothetical protein
MSLGDLANGTTRDGTDFTTEIGGQAVANKYAVEIQKAWETLPAAIGLTTRYLVYRLQDRTDSVPV